MHDDITAVDPNFFFVQDGAKSHTAAFTQEWLQNKDLIQPEDWPAKSPDMNPCDFFLWGKMLHELAKRRSQVKNTNSLKVVLQEIWMESVRRRQKKACQSFVKRLHKVVECEGGHIQAYL